MAENVIENNLVEERDIDEPAVWNDEEEQESAGVDEAIGNIQIGVELAEKDKELEQYFIAELAKLNHSTLLQMEPRGKLPKVTMDPEIQERSNKVLRMYYQVLTQYPRSLILSVRWEKLLGMLWE